MSAAERDGQLRSALAALRLDRSAPAAPPTAKRSGARVWRGLALAAALAGAAGLGAWSRSVDSPAVPAPPAPVVPAAGVAVPEPAGPVLSGAGYVITGDRYVSLGARVPGRVARYLVEEGERVAAGQPLVHLDDRRAAATLREAEAARDVAAAEVDQRRREWARLRALEIRGIASPAALERAGSALAVAEAEHARRSAHAAGLRLDLEDTVVRAPSDGLVLEKLKEVGEMAVPGGYAGSGELIRLANLAELRAEVDVNETDLARVTRGQPAEVVPDAFPERRYPARVVELAPQIDRQKGTLRVQVRILAPDERLRPDMSVRVHFLASAEADDGAQPAPTH